MSLSLASQIYQTMRYEIIAKEIDLFANANEQARSKQATVQQVGARKTNAYTCIGLICCADLLG